MSDAAPLAPWLLRARTQLLRQRGHAWLLQGPSGLGQYDLALSLAAAWLCERRDAAQPEQGACGDCPSCHAIRVRTHADLCVLMPEVAMQELDWPLDEKAQADIEDKKRKASREIRVEAMRDAVGFAQRTSARGRGKVVLVYPAERMNAIAANALLKTLEEPAGDLRFVLASEAAWQLLPTIRSRCLGYTLAWPEAQEAQRWLQEQGVNAADVVALLRAAGGRPEGALRLSRTGPAPKVWSQLPRAMARGDVAALADFSPAAAIDTLLKLCHDLLALRSGAAARFFDAQDLPPAPSYRILGRWSRSLMQAARTAEHPFNAGLMLESLVSEAQSALNSAARRP